MVTGALPQRVIYLAKAKAVGLMSGNSGRQWMLERTQTVEGRGALRCQVSKFGAPYVAADMMT